MNINRQTVAKSLVDSLTRETFMLQYIRKVVLEILSTVDICFEFCSAIQLVKNLMQNL